MCPAYLAFSFGFPQKALDEILPSLIIYGTPIGRCRWLWLPSGLNFAPKMFHGATVPSIKNNDANPSQSWFEAFNKCHICQPSVPYETPIKSRWFEVGSSRSWSGLTHVTIIPCPSFDLPVEIYSKSQWGGYITMIAIHKQCRVHKATSTAVGVVHIPPVLKFLDPEKPVEIFCDASSGDLSTVLVYKAQSVALDIFKKLLSTPMQIQGIWEYTSISTGMTLQWNDLTGKGRIWSCLIFYPECNLQEV